MKKNLLRSARANLYKRWTLHILYPTRYKMLMRRKAVQRRKIVFLEVRERTLSDSFIPVYHALKKSGNWELVCVFLRQDRTNRREVMARSLRAIENLVDARHIFINDSSSLIGALPVRPETKIIQLWHACGAFKKFGYSLNGKIFGLQKKELDRFPLYRNYTWVTVSSPEVIGSYAEAFSLPKERILPLGIARTDIYYCPAVIRRAKEKLLEILPECFAGGRVRRIVLYAPTFRGRVATASAPKLPDFSMLQERMGEEWLFLCKQHSFVNDRPKLPEGLEDFVRDLTEEMTIEELLMISDVCITDYSSIVFEYSLMERPVIFYTPDLKEYEDWRGFYYSLDEMPGPVVKTSEELGDCLMRIDTWFDHSKIEMFRKRFMSSCDGRSTERILRLLEEA